MIFNRKEIDMEYLYEMHSHVKEVSTCSGTYAEKFIEYYTDIGYTGIVLTDHMNESTFSRTGLEGEPWDVKVSHYLKGFEAVKNAAHGKLTILLGMEISFYGNPNDYLVYGVTEEFLRSHGDLMAMSAKGFSRLAHENGLLFLQAHPFRRGMKIENWDILDGYEVFNGNARHNSNNDFAELWAKSKGKTILTSGSDFHEKEDTANGGIYFNTPIQTNDDLIRELKSGNYRLRKTEF